MEDYTDDTFEAKVKDDCLTIVYRLLFIFYAESRDELDILPTNDEVYNQGYSLEMLRDLEKVPLISETSRNGFFIDDSLRQLFRLLSTGYHENRPMGDKSFTVTHIDSPLFNNAKLNYLGDVRIRNIAWQEIIQALSLSHRDRQVGRISYANLGVNQLGSVYESLLAYRGFYAEEDYIEVHKAGKPEEGTFLVPYSRMDDFEPNEILCDKDERPIILKQGTFVYRLNGRDRQKSASYYTPEILTRSTVKYTLKAIIDEVAEGKRKATELLDLKILEPAMGAAAFQNEVINQLAEAYLTYQQQQRREEGVANWRIAPDHYRDELQKVKAYIATHNVYGVDLNPTAIELGKLSLWLNVIHKDMETPFFSNRLALGNAVIGAWLKVYSREEFAGKPDKTNSKKPKLLPTPWWEKAPHKIKFFKNRVNRSVNEVYHFLLPDKAMLAVRNIAEQKKAHPEETTRMNTLIKNWTEPITDRDFNILKRLSGKIDLLLKEYFQFQQSVENLTQNKGNIWGVVGTPSLNLDTYAEKERLNDVRYRHDNAYFRLKMVMDYWCALWFWEYDRTADLPTREEYWNDIEAMLNVSDQELDASTTRALHNVHVDKHGQLGVFHEGYMNDMFQQAEYEGMVAREEANPYNTDADSEIIQLSKEQVLAETKGFTDNFLHDSQRYKIVMEYAARYHFFHPMLEFLEVFWLRDGFDIICGNPPWIKLEFDEVGIISEKYPEVAIRKMSAPDVRKKREELFATNPDLEALYRSEETENECSAVFLNAYQNYPLLVGQQTNLYKCILENGFTMSSYEGHIGLLHPETVYDDPSGQPLRKEIYHRLCYHFQYQNAFNLFEIGHREKYSSNIYGAYKDAIDFININNLFHPSTIDACFIHDGHGVCGGIKINDVWNTTGHRERLVRFTERELRILADAFENGADWETTKLVSIHAKDVLEVLKALSNFPNHVGSYIANISECWHETGAVDGGIISRETFYPDIDKYEMVYNGPQLYVANPSYKTPKAVCLTKADYDTINLTDMSDDYVARSNYRPIPSVEQYKSLSKGFVIGQDSEGNEVYDNWIDYYKVGFRKMINLSGERSLICAVLPRRTAHIHGVISAAFRSGYDTVDMAALCAAVPMDAYMKIMASQNLTSVRIQGFPLGVEEKYKNPLRIRTLMLNCLTKYYSELWTEIWMDSFKKDTWSVKDDRLRSFSTLSREWSHESPLRNYFERRQALVEIDVLSAMALGLTLENLETIYTIYFPVLQQNENDTWYDRKGNIVFTCSKGLTGVGVDRPVWEQIRNMKEGETYDHTIEKSELYRGQHVTYYAPFTRQDRIEDYRTAWAHFEKLFSSLD